MSKITNKKTFTFTTLNGHSISFDCETYEYTYGWGHRCNVCRYNPISNQFWLAKYRITYYNRTWEKFEYESLLYKAIGRLYSKKSQKLERSFLEAQVKAIANHEAEKAAAWFDTFKKTYDALKSETKEKLKKTDIILKTNEDADALIKAACMMDALI